ncbi:MAG: histidinol-phosphatase [Planctomycetes bacterium]|nr:histidinol-phosphatase [Planctomycetota bacterium]
MPLKRIALVALLLLGLSATQAQVRHEINFPDLPGYRTLKCDLHMHTVFSDGYVWPTVRVDEAWREGLDVIAITDHIEYQPYKNDIPTKHGRANEIAAGRARERDLLSVLGAEITRATPPGHYNAIFLSDVNPLDTEDFYEVVRQAAEQDAFVFWNHPGWKGPELGRWGEYQETLFERGQLHGIEICNGESYYAEAHQEALKRNLTLIGNSDIHDPALDHARTPANHRTVTLVFAKEKTLAALREALFARRTAVWSQNRLFGRQEHLAAMFQACVEVQPPHHRSGDKLWLAIKNHCELDIELQAIGDTKPATINLPAHSTSLLRLDASVLGKREGLPYRALNFLVGPDEALPVTLEIPSP